MLAGVVEHQLVKLAAQHLPGARAFVRPMIVEIEWLGKLAVLGDELDRFLADIQDVGPRRPLDALQGIILAAHSQRGVVGHALVLLG